MKSLLNRNSRANIIDCHHTHLREVGRFVKLGPSDPCGGRLGVPVASNTTPPITLHADSYGASLPPSQGLFCMCVSSAYMRLPPQWKGKCSLGYMHENLYLKMSNHLKAC